MTTAARNTLTGVPNQPKTPVRTVRLEDELWEAADEVADKANGETRSDVVREGVRREVARRKGQA